jgi:hypothetical protein
VPSIRRCRHRKREGVGEDTPTEFGSIDKVGR